MPTYSQKRLQRVAEAASQRSDDDTRHKVFVSFRQTDEDEVETFLDDFGHVLIPRILGVSDEDDFIDSDDTDYIMDQIRDKYLRDSSVTLVLVGKCTWARKYVDWEVYSSLRNDSKNRRSGLMAITLPSAANYAKKKLPARVDDNVDGTDGYARWWKYPSTADSLKNLIQTAFDDRAGKAELIDNTRPRKTYNATCP